MLRVVKIAVLVLVVSLVGLGCTEIVKVARHSKTPAPQAAYNDDADDAVMIYNNMYCYSFWAPHGGLWQDSCSRDRAGCERNLAESKDMFMQVNTDSCYVYSTTDAYCVSGVLTGQTRYDDFDETEYEVTTEVCVSDVELCKKFAALVRKGVKLKKSEICAKKRVSQRESEASYLTPKSELVAIAGRLAPRYGVARDILNVLDVPGCHKYSRPENQRAAFEKLGLDWARTNKWGAFVDTDGVLRADKPSCREIVRNSEEYNKYKKK